LRNPHAADGRDFRYSLTVGREYEVLGLSQDSYQLLNDEDEPILYDNCCFEVSDTVEPGFWVSHYGEEGERYASPVEWIRPGYFEDWHDGVPAVVTGFWRDLERLYPWTAANRRTRRCSRPR
jgi:hypothetical protein